MERRDFKSDPEEIEVVALEWEKPIVPVVPAVVPNGVKKQGGAVMGLKLRRFQEGKWFDYPEATGVRFLIRPLPLSVGLSIRSKIRERVATEIETKTGKQKGTKITTLLEDVDSAKFTWEIFDYILQDVEGISLEDVPGAGLDDIKQAIFDDVPIREFISEKSEIIRADGERKLKDEIKN
jgi:hypothetical protein